MRKSVLILLAFIFVSELFAQSMGLKIDKDDFAKIPDRSTSSKFRGMLPSSIDLTKYIPEIGNQGETGTCVAWSTGYYSRTMLHAIVNNVTDKSAITKNAFSPTYLYEKIKDPADINCQNGSNFGKAFLTLMQHGISKLSDTPFPACNTDVGRFDSDAALYKIKDFQRLDDVETTSELIGNMKEALALGFPVQIGVMMVQSFCTVGKDGIWKPLPNETCDGCGHAMAVVGYDDNVNGGSFRIVNSWGTGWGDEGLAWAKYEDLMSIIAVAVQAIPFTDKPKPKEDYQTAKVVLLDGQNNQSEVSFSSKKSKYRNIVTISDLADNEPDGESAIKRFISNKAYKSGDKFKLRLSLNNSAYVYALASDNSNSSVNLLFPSGVKGSSTSALIPGGMDVILPGNKASFRMDETTGKDYFVLLICETQLNVDNLLKAIESREGDFYTKVLNTIGDLIVPVNEINWKDNTPSFSLTNKYENGIVPILVELNHNAR